MRSAIPLLVCCFASFAAGAQDDPVVFRSTTDLVLVDVQVLQKRTGTPAGDVKAGDLRLFEDGVAQQIRFFSRDELPLSVVLLFDRTPTVHGPLKRLAQEAKAALEHFKAQDEVAVLIYGEGVEVVDGFSTDRERNARAIAKAAGMGAWQAAYFNEGVYQAVAQLRSSKTSNSRRVVIWLTDNEPNIPYHTEHPVHTEAEAFRALHEDGVVIEPILLRDAKWLPLIALDTLIEGRQAKKYPPGDAKKYAELTGGQALWLRGKSTGVRLGQLIDELRARYTLGYSPAEVKAPGTFCRLRVELAEEGRLRAGEWSVAVREGYYRK